VRNWMLSLITAKLVQASSASRMELQTDMQLAASSAFLGLLVVIRGMSQVAISAL